MTAHPVWPLINKREKLVPEKGVYWGMRGFGVDRGTGTGKYHAGIDLAASWGDPVVATEDGVIVGTQGWDGANAKAIAIETISGVVPFYGAVAPNSWKEFGLGVGSKVKQGQVIARVGQYPGGSEMLHFELYTSGTIRNEKYYIDKPRPSNLLDPTQYLKRAAGISVA
jgi:murein DD-endopeptidase MepM/ murein hydrolase activator NlpD